MTYSNRGFEPARYRRAQLSRHAKKRCQQRGIQQASIQLLRAFGECEYDGRGAVRYVMTAKAMTRLIRAAGRSKQVEALAGTYVVIDIDTDMAVTFAHLHH